VASKKPPVKSSAGRKAYDYVMGTWIGSIAKGEAAEITKAIRQDEVNKLHKNNPEMTTLEAQETIRKKYSKKNKGGTDYRKGGLVLSSMDNRKKKGK
tara:strand:- start:677 stop:967 length:291 start_codon:yes stop_codon:yes gene_type:complete